MSFSREVKEELSAIENTSECCLKAQCYGMLLYGKAFSRNRISFQTENENIAKTYCAVCEEYCSVIPKTVLTDAGNYSISISKSDDIKSIYQVFGHTQSNVVLRLNRANLEYDCCYGAFLRGVFLSAGTISNPNKNYHLEFIVSRLKLKDDLLSVLTDVGLSPKEIVRNGSFVIYFKDSESIEDILTLMGATSSSLELMGVKMVKDVRNKINRKINFETANISRTVNASVAQIDAINKIIKLKGLEFLPENLRLVAKVRLENPDMSLDELKKALGENISRSGVNHRLNKLIKIAESL